MPKRVDTDLRYDVEAELEFDPAINAKRIGVAVENGVVTLTGHVGSYFEKWTAEKIAKRILGVRAVANEISVELGYADRRDDSEIAQLAVQALAWNFGIPIDSVRVLVTNGHLTLEGQVPWQFQKQSAEESVRALRGVRRVTNSIVVKPNVRTDDVKSKIEAALKRSAEIESKCIKVDATDGSVTLAGNVRSWAEHDDAINAAWAAPGVGKVVDKLRIGA